MENPRLKLLKTSILWLVISFPLLLTHDARATHAMGADITYSCVGPNLYTVTLTFFRDCQGINPPVSEAIYYSSANCNVSGSISLSLIPGSPVDVTPICPGQQSNCGSGTGPFGVEEYTYRGPLSLPLNCADWVLSWSTCCRNYAITTLNQPGNTSMYLSAQLDNTVTPCNNSPVFNNIPTPIVCVGQPVTYNHGVTDPDGDQLVFSLGPCADDALNNVTYLAGYSAVAPLATSSGVTIDPATGTITFTPNQPQIGVICVVVEEFRNGVKIGQTIRDLQFNVIGCTNAPPVASGINGNSGQFSIDFCVGNYSCFFIQITDPENNNVTASWNNGITGGLFTIAGNGTQNPNASFCWQPTLADTGTHFFTVTVTDDNCPLTAQATYAFTINVQASLYTVDAGPDQAVCPGETATLSVNAPGATGFSWAPASGLSTTSGPTTQASPSVPTTYTVTASFPDGCAISDEVQVTPASKPAITVAPSSAFLCPGGTVNLQASSSSSISSWVWNTGATSDSLTVSPSSTTTYSVIGTGSNGCQDTAEVTVFVNSPNPQACNILYVSPNGSGGGTKSDPASLRDAINLANCSGTVIKLATGTYFLDSAISEINGNLTLEGGYDASNNWRKTSQAGATTLFRNPVNPDGPANALRLVAVYLNTANNVAFQDLTIATADAWLPGMSTYGVHITSSSSYAFTRVQIIPGHAANGQNGVVGPDGAAGGNGLTGQAGNESDKFNPGHGGPGGAGGGTGGGAGGLGGYDINGPSGCCNNGPAGGSGQPGLTAFPRAGGGGGGGGCGGEGEYNGGFGGSGGSPNGGAPVCCGASGGSGGSTCSGSGGENGADGLDGLPGLNGGNGTNGPPGAHLLGFWVPGDPGTSGQDGQGGIGGRGGGGGGGKIGCFACCRGAGSGGGGGGGGGEGGAGGSGGRGGGSSYGVYLYNAGNGYFLQSLITAGNAGAGGTGGDGGQGGPGGAGGLGSTYGLFNAVGAGGDGGDGGPGGNGGRGGSGQPGQSVPLYNSGSASPSFQDISFNLSAQPVISMADVSCVFTPVNFQGPVQGNTSWFFGSSANPQSTSGTNVNTIYASAGRRNVSYGGQTYAGFVFVAVSDTIEPLIGTNVADINGVYRICAGESIDLSALNGGTGYTYNWDLGGGATPNAYNGPAFSHISGITFSTPGVYPIALSYETDCCGLSIPDTLWLQVDTLPDLVFASPSVFCLGDDPVALNASGAASYSWSPAIGLTTPSGATVFAQPAQTTTYVVTGLNAAGTCADVDSVTLTVSDLSVSTNAQAAVCNPNGSATAIPAGGSGSYTYSWSTIPSQSSSTATGLAPGTYTVMINDLVTGCDAEGAVEVLPAPGTLSLFASQINPTSCYGNSDGSATIGVQGLNGTASVQWSPAGGNSLTSSQLPAGTYTVQVTDLANGCTASTQVTIPEAQPIDLQLLAITGADCDQFGTATVDASGANGPFFYSWSTGDTLPTASNLTPGSNRVYVTDQTGCTDSLDVIVPGSQSPVTMNLDSVSPASACFSADGSASVSATGGGGGLSYSWATIPPQTGPLATGLLPGNYAVYALGANGCGDTLVVTIGPSCVLSNQQLTFEVHPELPDVRLHWTVNEILGIEHFTVQRAIANEGFMDLAETSASAKKQPFTYLDEDPPLGTNLTYRLQIQSDDGEVWYSPSREIILPAASEMVIHSTYPLPAQDRVTVALELVREARISCQLFTIAGKQVSNLSMDGQAGRQDVALDISNLAEGVYVARWRLNGTPAGESRLIKGRGR